MDCLPPNARMRPDFATYIYSTACPLGAIKVDLFVLVPSPLGATNPILAP